jgi:GNAT superfamily N-acetyltransferase
MTTTDEEPRTHQPQAAISSSRWRETLWCWFVAGFEYSARATAMREGYVWSADTAASNVCTVAACRAEATESSSNPASGESPMPSHPHCKYSIRKAHPTEFSVLGDLTVDVYASLPGMPAVAEQADYYGVLRDVEKRAHTPATSVFTAVSDSGEVLGTVNFFTDMRQYGSGGAANSISNAAGIRYLVVKPERRGCGIGRSLTAYCISLARDLGKSAMILHTTKAMPTAWAMYERMGFLRCAELDFQQGALEVFGFRLDLAGTPFTVAPAIRDSASLGVSE